MERRTFIAGAGAVLLTVPLTTQAQRAGKVHLVGMIHTSSPDLHIPLVDAFRQGLRELGWVEGKNIKLELRTAVGHLDQLPAIVAELLRLGVDIFVTPSTQATQAARSATSTIPIVFVLASNPVGAGLVESLARPGGNITGLSTMNVEIGTKQLQLLKEVVPRATRVSVLRMGFRPEPILEAQQKAAPLLGIQLQVLKAGSAEEFDDAFAAMIKGHAQALLVETNPINFVHRKRLADLAVKGSAPGRGWDKGVCRGRRPCGLWSELRFQLPSGRRLRRQNSEGRQARGPTRRAAHQVRADHQPQDCQGTRTDNPAVGVGTGG